MRYEEARSSCHGVAGPSTAGLLPLSADEARVAAGRRTRRVGALRSSTVPPAGTRSGCPGTPSWPRRSDAAGPRERDEPVEEHLHRRLLRDGRLARGAMGDSGAPAAHVPSQEVRRIPRVHRGPQRIAYFFHPADLKRFFEESAATPSRSSATKRAPSSRATSRASSRNDSRQPWSGAARHTLVDYNYLDPGRSRPMIGGEWVMSAASPSCCPTSRGR